jgi:hypothetical protein
MANSDNDDNGGISPTRKNRRRHQRAVIISALAAGGVFQLNGWQVQAHGNRSSEESTVFQNTSFSPSDYVLLRQSAIAPNAPETRQLAQVTAELRALAKAHPGSDHSTDYQKLVAIKASLERKLQVRPTTSESLKYLRDGDVPAAVAVIEGEGWPERVLGEYSWALLDIAYLGRENEAFTGKTMFEFVELAKPAMAYCEKALASLPQTGLSEKQLALKVRVAEIYHNIASFTVPDDGTATADDLRLGRDAANRGLKLREEIGSQPEIMLAHWMVGNHAYRAGDLKTAEQHLRQSTSLAASLHDAPALAWANTYLAKVVASSNPAAARALEKEAQRAIDSVQHQDLSIEFLRIQNRLAQK